MRSFTALSGLVALASAAEPFLNEPDTGLETYLHANGWTEGTQPPLDAIKSLPDFDFAARNYLNTSSYEFYHGGVSGEWAYRNNLDVWSQVKFRSRSFNDVTKVNETLPTTILGYKFNVPFFICPAARAGLAHEDGELNFMEASAKEEALYMRALFATKSIEELGAVTANDTLNGQQVTFQQIYVQSNLSSTWDSIARAEKTGVKAIVWTIDVPVDANRHREQRWQPGGDSPAPPLTWDLYDEMTKHTKLPIIIKGISSVEDAQEAVRRGAKAIYISNHGARQLDHAPSSLEIAYEIHRNAPEIFQQVEVLADSGVRYGGDALKLLALGVRAVGLGRPFMYANAYGVEGVRKAIQILKTEIASDAAQIGVTNVRNITAASLNTRLLDQSVYLAQ